MQEEAEIMMLEYEWANPAAAMLLFGDGGQAAAGQVGPPMFEHQYGGNGMVAGELMFAPPQQMTAAALFSTTAPAPASAACVQRYGMGMMPAPARIGLNLGVRTYFSSASPDAEMGMGRVCRRRLRTARCQAEGCGADLTHAKHYHRRHKVCEFHSKASIVIAAGLSQRFCQQCSRFHVLSEFDQGKRSCRKRLADHNRRRRKSQDLTTISAVNNSNSSIAIDGDCKNNNSALISFEQSTSNNKNNTSNINLGSSMDHCNPETGSTVTRISSPAMALGLGCSGIAVSPAPAGLSGSSSTTVASPPRMSFFSHLAEIRGQEHRFLCWDDGDDGSSFRSLYQSK